MTYRYFVGFLIFLSSCAPEKKDTVKSPQQQVNELKEIARDVELCDGLGGYQLIQDGEVLSQHCNQIAPLETKDITTVITNGKHDCKQNWLPFILTINRLGDEIGNQEICLQKEELNKEDIETTYVLTNQVCKTDTGIEGRIIEIKTKVKGNSIIFTDDVCLEMKIETIIQEPSIINKQVYFKPEENLLKIVGQNNVRNFSVVNIFGSYVEKDGIAGFNIQKDQLKNITATVSLEYQDFFNWRQRYHFIQMKKIGNNFVFYSNYQKKYEKNTVSRTKLYIGEDGIELIR